MSRPKKHIKRQEKLTLYFTKAEIKVISKQAEKFGVAMAVYARKRALGINQKPRLTREEVFIFRQLAGMANNLNQLAHATNTGITLTAAIVKALQDINILIEKLR